MNTTLKSMTVLLAVGLCAPAFAQMGSDTSKSTTPSVTAPATSTWGAAYYRLSELTGAKVTSAAGENLGDINDFVVDQRGHIQGFAVIGMGGFLGIGEKLTPVPWNMLAGSGEKRFALNADKAKLQAAPTVDRSSWSQFDNPQFTSQIYSYYGVQMPEAVGGTGSTHLWN